MIARDLGLVVEPPSSTTQSPEVDEWRQRLETSQAERDQLRREVTELRARLDAEKADLQFNRMVAAVAVGAMLVLGAGVLWRWRRRRHTESRPWWQAADATGISRAEYSSGIDEAPFFDAYEQSGSSDAGNRDNRGDPDTREDRDSREARDIQQADRNAGENRGSSVEVGEPGIPAEPNTEEKPPGEGAAPDRGAFLRADALWSLWQTVDFWVALGQESEAVAALRAHAREHPEDGAWPLLRWAALARQQHLAADEAAAGAAYTETFGHPMSMAALEPDAPGVLDDPDLLSRLIHVWPSPAASSLVATALLAAPSAHDLKGRRSLPWYEDLLTLWAILQMRAQLPDEGNLHRTVEPSHRAAGEIPSLELVPYPETSTANRSQ